MKRTAYIWRKSMYDNGFNCCNCGTRCADDGAPNNNTLMANGLLFCRNCKTIIAKVTEVDIAADVKPGTMMGSFEEWQKKKMN